MAADSVKILYCSFDVVPTPSGTSARASDCLRALTSAYEVDGLTVKTPEHSHIERFHGVRLMRVPVGSGDLPVRVQAFERAVRRQLESDEYRVVHFTDPFGGYPLCELRAQYNFKVVFEIAGLPTLQVRHLYPHVESDRRFMAKLRRQELFCLMNADAVVVGSSVTAAFVQQLGVPRDRVVVIPTAIDMSIYAAHQPTAPDRDPMRILYLGSQLPWQGLECLLEAVAIVAAARPVRLAVVGPQLPAARAALDALVERHRMSSFVEFADPVAADDLPRLLATADVGVAPLDASERNSVQGAPISKIAHYLAAGRPLVAADLPMVREITDPRCALYYTPGDAKGLAAGLLELAAAPARRVRMGQEAEVFARARLSAAVWRPRWLQLYQALSGVGELAALASAPRPNFDEPTSIAGVAVSGVDTELHAGASQEEHTFIDAARTGALPKREGGTDPFAGSGRVGDDSLTQTQSPAPPSALARGLLEPLLFRPATTGTPPASSPEGAPKPNEEPGSSSPPDDASALALSAHASAAGLTDPVPTAVFDSPPGGTGEGAPTLPPGLGAPGLGGGASSVIPSADSPKPRLAVSGLRAASSGASGSVDSPPPRLGAPGLGGGASFMTPSVDSLLPRLAVSGNGPGASSPTGSEEPLPPRLGMPGPGAPASPSAASASANGGGADAAGASSPGAPAAPGGTAQRSPMPPANAPSAGAAPPRTPLFGTPPPRKPETASPERPPVLVRGSGHGPLAEGSHARVNEARAAEHPSAPRAAVAPREASGSPLSRSPESPPADQPLLAAPADCLPPEPTAEADPADVMEVPSAGHAPPAVTPASGCSPTEEWVGHVLFGYAPFRVKQGR